MKSRNLKRRFISSAVMLVAVLTFVSCTKSTAEKNDDTTLLTYLLANQHVPTGAQADCVASVYLMNQCISAVTKLDAGANCSLEQIATMQALTADYAAIKTKVVTKYNTLKCNLPENIYTSAADAITAFKGDFTVTGSDGKETTVFTSPTYY